MTYDEFEDWKKGKRRAAEKDEAVHGIYAKLPYVIVIIIAMAAIL
jgi:hypothetical protein